VSSRHPQAGAASQQHAVTPDDHRAIDERRILPALEWDDVDPRESLGRNRQLELALMTELDARGKR
jgi:hypothetical protein